MGNAAHLLNRAAGMEMIASQDHPLVLSSGIHRGTTVQRAAQSGAVHLAAHSEWSSSSLSTGQMYIRLAVLSGQLGPHF